MNHLKSNRLAATLAAHAARRSGEARAPPQINMPDNRVYQAADTSASQCDDLMFFLSQQHQEQTTLLRFKLQPSHKGQEEAQHSQKRKA